MKAKLIIIHSLGITSIAISSAQAQSPSPSASAVPVTVGNFERAESDLYFNNAAKEGGFGKFLHIRQPTEIEHQMVVRMNRDTLYSSAVFDLDAGPVTVTFPDAGGRFMSMEAIDEDHYVHGVFYGGKHIFNRKDVGTRYVLLAVRTLVDPANADDLKQVHALQDAIKVEQPGGPGRFEIPNWDLASQKKVRGAIAALGAASPLDSTTAFGTKSEVDPVMHLIGTAVGWGGNPNKEAHYTLQSPEKNDGKIIYRLTVPASVPVDGFWSVTVYNADGYFEKNDLNAYSLNNITAKKNADGSVAIQFGGCDGKIPNCLPITKGWNYTVRMYRPRANILNGKWKFPEAQPQ